MVRGLGGSGVGIMVTKGSEDGWNMEMPGEVLYNPRLINYEHKLENLQQQAQVFQRSTWRNPSPPVGPTKRKRGLAEIFYGFCFVNSTPDRSLAYISFLGLNILKFLPLAMFFLRSTKQASSNFCSCPEILPTS